MSKILLVTPPLTQLNTPYPATAYLSAFLKGRGYEVDQADLGIELVLEIFSRDGLQEIFDQVDEISSEEDERIMQLQSRYLSCIEPVIRYLQNKDLTQAHRICSGKWLPEGSRFSLLDEMDHSLFGSLAVEDKARLKATLFLEDLGDFIRRNIDKGFGFSRYREKISVAASSFHELDASLQQEDSYLDTVLLTILERHLTKDYDLVGFTVPFPGNLYGALKCAAYVKDQTGAKVLLGGGYVNTELRQLSEPAVFKYTDFITLDDGELPVIRILEHLHGKKTELQRTYILEEGAVKYLPLTEKEDFPHTETGFPDYSGLKLSEYLNIIEIANPMHRLWNDGSWNKLTVAHGCYWKRCSFCDVTLDYIERYDEAPAKLLADRIESIISQTGQSGFHFVDEAAPPAVLRDLAIEILNRDLPISWWTNIRFERAFNYDLCRLLAESGCIAVSGGLEVASDRLLSKMKKGTSLDQVTESTQAFTEAGIMVHAYLMYGFPTETEQETVDSLEVVRQLFKHKLIQSGFWHRFALTEHSPIGKSPQEYGIEITGPEFGGFARNELTYNDPDGCDHGKFSEGLRKSLFNFMHGTGVDFPLEDWFDFEIPRTSHSSNLIALKRQKASRERKKLPENRVLWIGSDPLFDMDDADPYYGALILAKNDANTVIEMDPSLAEWFYHLLPQLTAEKDPVTWKEVEGYYSEYFEDDFADFQDTDRWRQICEAGLLILR